MSFNNVNPDQRDHFMRVDMTQIFLRQLERVLRTAGTHLYETNIKSLLMTLPMQSRVVINEQEDRWNPELNTLIFKKWSGQRMGSEHDPLCDSPEHTSYVFASELSGIIDPETGDVDWSDPRIMSPRMEVRAKPDPDMLLDLILDEAQNTKIIHPDQKKAIIQNLNHSRIPRNRTKRQ